MRTLDATGDTDMVEEVPPVLSPEPPVKKRRSPADKWDALSILARLDLLDDMESRGMLPKGSLMRERYENWESLDMRFGNLLFDVQEKVESYIRKNYEDKD